jgi:hypothetical protein
MAPPAVAAAISPSVVIVVVFIVSVSCLVNMSAWRDAVLAWVVRWRRLLSPVRERLWPTPWKILDGLVRRVNERSSGNRIGVVVPTSTPALL